MTSSLDNIDATESRLRYWLTRYMQTMSEQDLFDCVLDEDVILRTSAARQIQMRGTADGFEFAVSLASSSRFEHREASAFILGQLGAPECTYLERSLKYLYLLLVDQYYEVRTTAVYAFSFYSMNIPQKIPEIVDKLRSISDDISIPVKVAVAHTLGFIYHHEAKKCLMNMVHDQDHDVRKEAEYSLELHEENSNNISS
jgi:HEAT repeat protein